MKLVISAEALAAVAADAEAAYPEEACGLLVGMHLENEALVRRVIAAANTAENDRRRNFEVDPRVLLAAHREARGAGEAVLGPWHSHPNGSATPSATDAACALAEGEIWLIVPVAAAGAGPPRAHIYDGAGRYAPLEIAAERRPPQPK